MPSDTGHKSIAILMTLGLLLLLAFLIGRHSPYAASLLEYFKSSPPSAEVVATKTALALPDLIKKIKPSVVEITTYDSADDPEGVGSGFFIGPRQVISNWHVVNGCYRAEIKTVDSGIYSVKGILASDKEADLVMLEVDIKPGEVHSLKIASNLPDEGEKIVIVGNPLGLEGTVSDGIVSSIRDIPKLGRLVQVTAPISHGSSGGPVVNMFGEVVGVARGMLTEGQNLNFAVPGDQIATLKRGPLVTFADFHRKQAVDLYDQASLLVEHRSFDSAIPLLRRAVAEDRNFEQAWSQLGNCEFQSSQYKNALDAYKQVVRINPASEEGLYQAGRASAELELWNEAIELYRKAIQINPKNVDAQFGLGLALCCVRDVEGAQKIYQILVRINPNRAAQLYESYPEIIAPEP